jgi:predicted Zn-dependent protease
MPRNLEDRIYRRQMDRRDFLWLLGLTSASTAVPGLLAGCATDPVTGGKSLVGLSEEQEVGLDRKQSPQQFSADYGAVQDDTLNRYVQEVGTSLWSKSHRPGIPYSARALNANYVNAYTFPGGSIGVTRGILLEMDSEDELAALMGHEIGHVNARHAAEQAGREMVAGAALNVAAVTLAATDNNQYMPLLDLGGKIGASALLAKYSRDDEREADALGMEYMNRGGYNPDGMVGLMDMLRTESQHKPGLLDTMFASHPMSDERFQTAVRQANEKYAGQRGRPLQRQRYLDHTAQLRHLKPAVEAMQEGEAQLRKKNLVKAEERFGHALRLAPGDYVANLLMAKAKLAQKQPREADPYLEQARAIYPREAQAQQMSGLVKLALKQPEAALERFETYDRLLPGNPGTLFFKGVAYENMQNRRLAAEHYYRYAKTGAQGKEAQYAVQRLKTWGMVK